MRKVTVPDYDWPGTGWDNTWYEFGREVRRQLSCIQDGGWFLSSWELAMLFGRFQSRHVERESDIRELNKTLAAMTPNQRVKLDQILEQRYVEVAE